METISLETTPYDAGAFAPGRVTRDALDRLYATGHWLYSRNRYLDAAAVFRVLVLCLPDEERGYLALGACHESLGQEGIALEIYNTATLTAPSAPRCHVARARLLRRSGQGDHADAALEEAEAIAERENDDHLRALVACERAQPSGEHPE